MDPLICLAILATFWSGEIGTGNTNHSLIKATPTSQAHIKMADSMMMTSTDVIKMV